MRPSAIFQLIVIFALGLTQCLADESAPLDPPLSAGQLDSLTAPIALYPDALVAQILTAATYPLEVVEAAHWLENPSNTALRDVDLAAALEHEDWDLSVKSLVPFPDTLRMMERNLQWTERIGDAFLEQQSDVMDSIQRLRKLAISAGTLKSTPQQTVWNQDDEIVVEPVSPDVVYVPYYNPSVVYGSWPWAEYAPFSFPPPSGIYLSGPTVVFGIGFTVIRPLWGWSYWSWPRHGLFIPPHLAHTWPLRPGPWRHDPDHRRGLPYGGRDHRPVPPERPVTPRTPLRPHVPPPGQPRQGDRDDRTDHPPLRRPLFGGEPPKRDVHPPGQPRTELPSRSRPPADHPRSGPVPPAHRPEPPAGNGGYPGEDRSRHRPPADLPRFPTGPSTQGAPPSGRGHENRPPSGPPAAKSAGPRAQPPTFGAPQGGRADPSRSSTPPDRSAAARGREPPRKPQ